MEYIKEFRFCFFEPFQIATSLTINPLCVISDILFFNKERDRRTTKLYYETCNTAT